MGRIAKLITKYDRLGAPGRIVRDGTTYHLWDEYFSKSEAQAAIRFGRKHGSKGFVRRYLSNYRYPVYAYYATIKK